MRWRLLKRRLSVSAPRVIVRSHMPWPLRWAVVAVVLGFSAAIALWAFEFGKEIAGLDRASKEELLSLRAQAQQLRQERDKAQSIGNTAESLLKTERVAQEKLAQQVRTLEADNMALRADLGFFERLLPSGGEGLAVRALHAEIKVPGQLRYQMLVMQSGKQVAEFNGRYEVTLSGTLDGKVWTLPMPAGPQTLRLQQYTRVEGTVAFAPLAVVKVVTVKVLDAQGQVRANQSTRL